MCWLISFGDTKDLAYATAKFLVKELGSACKGSNNQEQNARAVAELFSSADMKDVYDSLDVMAFEVTKLSSRA